MKGTSMIRKLVLSLALVTVASFALPAQAKRAAKTRAAQPVVAIQEEAPEEASMNAKLVVDSSGSAGVNSSSVNPAVDSLAAAPVIPPAEPMPGEASVANMAGGDSLAKKDMAKLPETEIPVMSEAKDKKEASSSGMARVLITLGVLAVALGAITFGLKRWAARRNPKSQNAKIQILTQHALGPKKSLMIVQVAGESLLIGVTDHNISMLKTLSLIDDEIPENMPRNFNSALDEYAEDDAPDTRSGKKQSRDRDDFTMRGLSEIRDTVSSRIKNMKNF
jgi:flagellar protein FliO/FliZ